MDKMIRIECPERTAPGERAKVAFGFNGHVKDHKAHMEFLTVSSQYGESKAISHEQAAIYVENAAGVSIRYGKSAEKLCDPIMLVKGDVISVETGDWYRYEFENENSYAELIVFINNAAPNYKRV